MSSKANALRTLTNTAGKRKSDDGAAGSMKKLKSHDRKMSTADARDTLANADAKLKVQNKIISDKQKEIRELKKKLKIAEGCVATAKAEITKIEAANRVAMEMANSDADLIMQKVKKESSQSWVSGGRAEKLGRDAMEDIISLDSEEDYRRLVECIGGLSNESVLVGALKALMAEHQQTPSMLHAASLRVLYLPFLVGTVTECSTWSVVASAMTASMNCCEDEDAHKADWARLPGFILKTVDEMEKNSPVTSWGSYDASKHKCPIIDLLLPTYKAIGNDVGGTIKSDFWNAIKLALLKSVDEAPKDAPSFAMPDEAKIVRDRDILAKKLNKEFIDFLLSPTEISLNLNLSKAGRMAVHRLIDNHMGYGKLSHSSQGYGRERFLVITKKNAPHPGMTKKNEELKQQHKEILAKYVHRSLVLQLPPQGTRVGLTLNGNAGNMPVLKQVAPDSPVLGQIPAELQKDCFIASLKSDVVGHVQPKSVQDCVAAITKTMGGKLEIALIPMNETQPPNID